MEYPLLLVQPIVSTLLITYLRARVHDVSHLTRLLSCPICASSSLLLLLDLFATASDSFAATSESPAVTSDPFVVAFFSFDLPSFFFFCVHKICVGPSYEQSRATKKALRITRLKNDVQLSNSNAHTCFCFCFPFSILVGEPRHSTVPANRYIFLTLLNTNYLQLNVETREA